MEQNFFQEVKKRFGFGCMRLPLKDGDIDYGQVCEMVDEFLKEGFNYFDTAHGYHSGKSEIAIKKCLTSRYPREKYILTDKLTKPYFQKEEDIRPFFESQLEACGVSYFDFYLMHAQQKQTYYHFKKCHAYETAFQLKKEGKIKHVGISFHDTPELLEEILTDYPEIEVVQIQFNYLDNDSPVVQSRKCYEVCVKHNKPVIVMEPVKGGTLANLLPEARGVLDELNPSASSASYAIRYVASEPQVMMVLSGMSNQEQMRDNLSYMKDFVPLSKREREAIAKIVSIYQNQHLIACTSCRYCVEGCPKRISIPDLFSCYNAKNLFKDWNADFYYNNVYTIDKGKASECIKCGKCENTCPQHLPIRSLLEEVAKTFEKKEG